MSIIPSRQNTLLFSTLVFILALFASLFISLLNTRPVSAAPPVCYANNTKITCPGDQGLLENTCYGASQSTGGLVEITCPAPKWIDAARIEYRGVIYTDPRWDSTAVFAEAGSAYQGDHGHEDFLNGECKSYFTYLGSNIVVQKSSSEVGFNPTADSGSGIRFHERIETRTSGCEIKGGVDLSITGQGNLDIWFYKSGDQLINVFGLADQNESDVFGPYEVLFDDEPNVYYNSNLDGTRSTITVNAAGTSADWVLRMVNNGSIVESSVKTIQIGAEDTIPGNLGDDIAGLQQSCESVGGAFSFGLCPLLDMASDGIERVDRAIRKSLEVKPVYYENGDIKEVWGRFRNIGYILLIPIMLVMVIATALGFKGIDAYTVKRVMPRLFAAVIFMALSYDIAIIMIEVTNGVGQSVAGLIAEPFGGTDALKFDAIFNPGAGSGLLITGALGTGLLAGIAIVATNPAMLGLLASYLGIAALALIIIFAILTIRELIIVFLMIFAPLAILSWIFPGNDKLWKLWWNSFTKLLMLYPLIVGALILGRAFAVIANEIEVSGIETIFMVLVKLTAYIGPFFFIPKMFTFAGGAFASLAGMANDRSKGLFDRQKKYRAEKRKGLWKDAKEGRLLKNAGEGNTKRKKLNENLAALTNIKAAATNPGDIFRSGGAGDAWSRMKGVQRTKEIKERDEILKDPDAKPLDDDVLARATVDTDSAQGLRENLANNAGYLKKTGMLNTDANDNIITRDNNGVEQTQLANGNWVNSSELSEHLTPEAHEQIERDVASIQTLRSKYGGSTQAFKMAALSKAQLGGTAMSAQESFQAAVDIAGNDTALLASIVADIRTTSKQAGRYDIGGGNFGDSLRYAQALGNAQNDQERADATQAFGHHVFEANGAAALTHSSMKKQSIEAMIPIMQERVIQRASLARISGDQKEVERAGAEAAQIYETLNQTSPRYAQRFGDEVMSQEIQFERLDYEYAEEPVLDQSGQPAIDTTTNIPVTRRVRVVDPNTGKPVIIKRPPEKMQLWQAVEEMRGKEQYESYHQVRREFMNQQQAMESQQAQQGAAQATQGYQGGVQGGPP